MCRISCAIDAPARPGARVTRAGSGSALLEGFGDQRRADRARRIARAEGDQAAAPAHRYRRRRHEIAQQVEDVLHVVLQAEAFDTMKLMTVSRSSGDRPLARQMRVLKARYFDSGAATQPSPRLTSIRAAAPAVRRASQHVADVERRMRPGRLRQILDRRRQRWLPSTSSTSPGCSVRRSVSGSDGV